VPANAAYGVPPRCFPQHDVPPRVPSFCGAPIATVSSLSQMKSDALKSTRMRSRMRFASRSFGLIAPSILPGSELPIAPTPTFESASDLQTCRALLEVLVLMRVEMNIRAPAADSFGMVPSPPALRKRRRVPQAPNTAVPPLQARCHPSGPQLACVISLVPMFLSEPLGAAS